MSEADGLLLEQIRQRDPHAWGDLVQRYQGRLHAFARTRLNRSADADDLVQDTFIAFMQSVLTFRGQASIESLLFQILRRRLIDRYRSKSRHLCLIDDQLPAAPGEQGDALAAMPGESPTASWHAQRQEWRAMLRQRLADALGEFIDTLKAQLDFVHLQMAELLFYAQVPNARVAELLGVDAPAVALFKHRSLKRLAEAAQRQLPPGEVDLSREELATVEVRQVWSDLRLSCPKRHTIGAYLLGALEPDWHAYVHFHLHKLGCTSCLANLKDLQAQSAAADVPDQRRLRDRILQSTIGFLSRPGG